jgi:D-alanyl-D-alanine carboxypeptidase
MPRRRPLLTVVVGVVVVLLVLVDGAGWLPVRDDEPDGSLRVAGLHELLDELVAKPAVAPGAAAALLTPQGSWSGATGMADIEARRPLLPDNRFRIASITKTYVAAVVLQLVHEGAVRLGDPVAARLPDVFPPDKAAITVRQLLNHSSGLYDSMNDAVREFGEDVDAFLASFSDAALRRRLAAAIAAVRHDPTVLLPPSLWVEIAMAKPLYFAPGDGNYYSNTNYILLGDVVERVTGSPLGDVLRERLFEPLGLDDTFYVPGPELPPPYAHGYVLPGGDAAPIDETEVTAGIAGASSLVADADDVARFYRALLGGAVLPARLLETMLAERMGIGAIPMQCGVGYGHDGGWTGYASYARASRDGGTVAVLLLNGRGRDTGLAAEAALTELFCSSSRS